MALQFGADARRLRHAGDGDDVGPSELDPNTEAQLAALGPSLEELGSELDTFVNADEPTTLAEASDIFSKIVSRISTSDAWMKAVAILGNSSLDLDGLFGPGPVISEPLDSTNSTWEYYDDMFYPYLSAWNASELQPYIDSFLLGLDSFNVSSFEVGSAVGNLLDSLNSTSYDDLFAELEMLDFNSTDLYELRDWLSGQKQNIQDAVSGFFEGNLGKILAALTSVDEDGGSLLDGLAQQLTNLNLTQLLGQVGGNMGGARGENSNADLSGLVSGVCGAAETTLKSLSGPFADLWDNTLSDVCAGVSAAPLPAPTQPVPPPSESVEAPAPGGGATVDLPADLQRIVDTITSAGPTTDLKMLGGELFAALLKNFKSGELTESELSSSLTALSADINLDNEQLADVFAGFLNAFAQAPPADEAAANAVVNAITSGTGTVSGIDVATIAPLLLAPGRLEPETVPKLLPLLGGLGK